MVCRSVGLSVTTVRPAKADEPIVMAFAMLTRVGPRNHVSDGVQTPPREGAPLRGMTLAFSTRRRAPFPVALTSGFPRMLSITGWPQKQLSVTLNFPN